MYKNKTIVLPITIIAMMIFISLVNPIKVYGSDILEWKNAGAVNVSDNEAQSTSIAIDRNNVPYIAYIDYANGATVKKYNRATNEWNILGTQGFTNNKIAEISIAIDRNNVPYVVYREDKSSSGVFNEMGFVQKYNSTTNAWDYLDTAGFSPNPSRVRFPVIAIDSKNVPYVAYQDCNNDLKMAVKKYNTSGHWEDVCSTNTTISNGTASNISMLIDSSDRLYVGFQDGANESKATVKKYYSENNQWDRFPKPYSEGSPFFTSMAIDSKNWIYFAYQDQPNRSKITVKKIWLDSPNPWWVDAGNKDFSTGAASNISMAVDSSDGLYVAYKDAGNGGKGVVKKYNIISKNWDDVGGNSFSASAANYTSMAIDRNNIPYVVYQDASNQNKASVMRYCMTTAVIYDGNGNTGGTVPMMPTDGTCYIANSQIKVMEAGDLTKTGYSFVGWNTNKDGTGISYKPSETFLLGTQSLTLYAQWDKGTRYEAENATLNGPTKETITDGSASGGSQVGSIDKAGENVEFKNMTAYSKVLVHYASMNSGKISVYLNDDKIKDLNFTSTDGWSGDGKYKDLIFDVNIPSGGTLKFQYDNGDAALNLDYIEYFAPMTVVRYEAENATISDPTSMKETGTNNASGGGQVGSINEVGKNVEFKNMPVCKKVLFRYATKQKGTISIYKNGDHYKDLSFESTGDWSGNNNYRIDSIDIDINAGDSLKVQYDNGDAAINLDYIEVLGTPVTGITLDKTLMNLITGSSSGTLTATVAPDNATNKNISWTSSKPEVATVANGVVTPIAAGTTTITATTEDERKTATCEVAVIAKDCPVTYRGSQMRTNAAGTTIYDIRFLATIDTLDADEVGFVFSKTQKEPTKGNVDPSQIISTTKVYTSVTAMGSNVTAVKLGGTYIIACTIKDIPEADAAAPIYVRAFSTKGTETKYTEVKTITVNGLK